MSDLTLSSSKILSASCLCLLLLHNRNLKVKLFQIDDQSFRSNIPLFPLGLRYFADDGGQKLWVFREPCHLFIWGGILNSEQGPEAGLQCQGRSLFQS